MARVIADELGADLDVVLVHKLGAPGQPELAIGSVDEFGEVYLSAAARYLRLDDSYIEYEKYRQLERLRERREVYTQLRPPIDPAGRTVIVVDDGIATGATMIAGLRAVRAKGPKKLVAAAGVASPEALERISGEADAVVCLLSPPELSAVGQYFEDFSQVSAAEVADILLESSRKAGRGRAVRG
jgi:predicted phosphoribosyltransferase